MIVPQYYEFINKCESIDSPAMIHASDTSLAWFFRRYFMQEVLSVIEFEGIPEHWDKDYFLYTLFMTGRVAVIKTKKWGVIPQFCTLNGWNIYYLPSHAMIVNPLFRESINPRIGVECSLIKMQPDYGGAWDLVDFYGCLTAIEVESLVVNVFNTKLAYVFAADNESLAASFKKLYDKIASGEPAAVAHKKLFDDEGKLKVDIFNQNIKNTFVGEQIMNLIQQTRADFHTKICVPNVNIAKASGVGSAEVNANNVEVRSLAELWLDTVNTGLNMTNKMYGTNISAKLRFIERGSTDAKESNSFGNGDL